MSYKNVRACIFRFHRSGDTLHLSSLGGKCNFLNSPACWNLRYDLSRQISAEMGALFSSIDQSRTLILSGPQCFIAYPLYFLLNLSFRHHAAKLAAHLFAIKPAKCRTVLCTQQLTSENSGTG
jgi:hypothetical protein